MSKNAHAMHGFKSVRVTELIHGRPTPTYEPGRVCGAPDCHTHLSLYNPRSRCAIHDHVQ
jgi:hypothetical protein